MKSGDECAHTGYMTPIAVEVEESFISSLTDRNPDPTDLNESPRMKAAYRYTVRRDKRRNTENTGSKPYTSAGSY